MLTHEPGRCNDSDAQEEGIFSIGMEDFEVDESGEPEEDGCEENDGESDENEEYDEPSLEPNRLPYPLLSNSNDIEVNDGETQRANQLRGGAEAELNNKPYVVKFGGEKAGAVYTDQDRVDANAAYTSQINNHNNPFSPFSSQIEWEIAHWAKTRGPSSTAFTEFMSIEGVSGITVFCALNLDLIYLICILGP